MQDLIKQEQFELEVLDRLNSKKLLSRVVFCGGTMLRLCHGLNRFSVDLDFWVSGDIDEKAFFKNVRECLALSYEITDSAMKFHTMLFEIRSKGYPRRLKIEIRREAKNVATENVIAYSPHSNIQVIIKAARLDEVIRSKVEAFLGRHEARDIFDIEFLLKKGIKLDAISVEKLRKVMQDLEKLYPRDCTAKLGPLLEAKDRAYYSRENFKILKSAFTEAIGRG
ncbi:MAG: nucleotidyl transferase AbiEii/AbiGii toxin family protein [Candidatus Omnitrophica bacterium]|nr:nucleotidyl transferase AbiEii/AbiGii toxin family protein [Candidatus Omnitrophota bacterium]